MIMQIFVNGGQCARYTTMYRRHTVSLRDIQSWYCFDDLAETNAQPPKETSIV